MPQLSAIRLRLLLLLLLLLLYLYLTSFFLMLQAGGRRSVKQKAQAFTSGQSRSRPDSGTVEGCARQPRCTKNPRGFCEHSCAAMRERLYLDFADDDDGHTGDHDRYGCWQHLGDAAFPSSEA